MSGSPIIQNDNIVGAVNYVLVDDTKKGYGIFITNMLKEAENQGVYLSFSHINSIKKRLTHEQKYANI